MVRAYRIILNSSSPEYCGESTLKHKRVYNIYSSEQPGFQNVQPLIPDISNEEVKRAIKEKKSCKALGEDGITFEVIRAGGQIIEDTKNKLILRIPEEWK